MNEDEIDRSLIDAAREELGPTQADRARLRRAVSAAIAAGAAGTAGVAGSSAAAQGALVGAGWGGGKIAIACAIAIAAIGGAATLITGDPGEPAGERRAREAQIEGPTASATARTTPSATARTTPSPTASTTPSPTASTTPSASASTTPSTIASTTPSTIASTSATGIAAPRASTTSTATTMTTSTATTPTAAAAGATPARASTRPLSPVITEPRQRGEPSVPAAIERARAAPVGADAIREETLLLRRAHEALQVHDSDRALALLAEHADRFPEGTLAEERLATRVLALCDADRIALARAEGVQFLARHPHSLHAARVRGSCVRDP